MVLASASTALLLPFSLVALLFSSAASAEQASVEYTEDSAFRSAILNATNTYRKQHNATGLEWNDTLAEYALDWGGDCKFGHSVSIFRDVLLRGLALIV